MAPTPNTAAQSRLRLSRTHRLLGMIATVPLIGWVASSFVLHAVGLTLPNGLQGVYELRSDQTLAVPLEDDSFLSPSQILGTLREDGLERVYWLRLEALGGRPVFVVKPGPFSLERTYDARSGARLDPLDDEFLRSIGDGELVGTQVAAVRPAPEFNRYYTVDLVPAVGLEMDGAQPSRVVVSRASGRTLRRTDPLAGWFHTAYMSVHVLQWGSSIRVFTALLYGLVGLTLGLVTLGYILWYTRRAARRRWTDHVRPARRWHARLAPLAGVILSTQMLVGAFLWYNLGLIEPRFRGQGSFATEWSGGIGVDETLARPSEIATHLPESSASGEQRILRYEWRGVDDSRFWIAYTRRDANGTLFDATSGQVLDRLTPDVGRAAGQMVVSGTAVGPAEESTEYWMDFNARVPTYRFRFTDRDESDVHVSQITGEVVQRRPAIWRRFGPFLTYHTFGFTGNPWIDTALLTALQLVVLIMIASGWRLALSGRKT